MDLAWGDLESAFEAEGCKYKSKPPFVSTVVYHRIKGITAERLRSVIALFPNNNLFHVERALQRLDQVHKHLDDLKVKGNVIALDEMVARVSELNPSNSLYSTWVQQAENNASCFQNPICAKQEEEGVQGFSLKSSSSSSSSVVKGKCKMQSFRELNAPRPLLPPLP